ncbi:platelet glycoprotein Ib alpha chain [Nerophis ophidion]|uniref:platelet glycoprotein Ib alpha chain n=1 Tax=Nerophis ophidion TaxID=159077 RepID=UPI002AE072F9|nr:platelet glycoprotein Ib alpha chain [Nerophis ophidion]
MKLSIFVLWSGIVVVTAMDGCHSDRDNYHQPRLNCTAAGFTHVPAGLDLTTKVLLFPRNLFASLFWESFQVFSEIHEIDLTANEISQVRTGSAALLQHLAILRLGHNRLTSLEGMAFHACPALTKLFLDNNAIESLSDDTFSGLGKLENLDLSANRIRVLPPLLLHPLVIIKTLSLENNRINVLPDDWFSQKKVVPYLYFAANPWACNCTLTYLRTYLEEYEVNFYVLEGELITMDPKRLVCDSPQHVKGQAILLLPVSDFCLPITSSQKAASSTRPYTMSTEGEHWGMAKVRGDGAIFRHIAPTTEVAPTTQVAPTTEGATLPALSPTTVRTSVAPISTEVTWNLWQEREQDSGRSLRHTSGMFCLWLFAGNMLLCAAAAVYTLLILTRLVVWYRVAHKSLRATLAMRGGAQLLQLHMRAGPESGAVYRSVLFISRKSEGAVEGQEGGWQEQGVPRAMYRTTLHHPLGHQVTEAASRERFSVILRKEREEPSGRREELDWVVGGWQVSPNVNRSSWGAWLAQRLPSTPWDMTTPPE